MFVYFVVVVLCRHPSKFLKDCTYLISSLKTLSLEWGILVPRDPCMAQPGITNRRAPSLHNQELLTDGHQVCLSFTQPLSMECRHEQHPPAPPPPFHLHVIHIARNYKTARNYLHQSCTQPGTTSTNHAHSQELPPPIMHPARNYLHQSCTQPGTTSTNHAHSQELQYRELHSSIMHTARNYNTDNYIFPVIHKEQEQNTHKNYIYTSVTELGIQYRQKLHLSITHTASSYGII